MPLIAPVLDDRSFEQLRNELVNRIPVYNPDWTDHNRSDPAITLLELFAYLGEGLQFRFNQIPEATQLAFLKLLDLPLQPARPATALVRCKTQVASGVMLYAGDQLKAGKSVFTIETEAQVWPIDCVSVARRTDEIPNEHDFPELHAVVQAAIDRVALDRPDLAHIKPYRNVLLEADGTSPPASFVDTVDNCVWIAVLKDKALALELAPGKTPHINLGFSPSARTPALREIASCPGEGVRTGPALVWNISAKALAADGTPRYLPLRVASDTTAGFTEQGVVRLELPASDIGVPEAAPGLAGTGDFPPVLDEKRAENIWFWLRVWRSDKSGIGDVRLICVNAIECVQSVQAVGELLGSGSGQPEQVFQLTHRPVLIDPLHQVKLQVEESGVWKEWAQRDDLDASTRDDRHFTVDAEAGTVRFGERFPQIGERVRVTSYRYGGGSAGNVPPNAISKLGDLLPGAPPAAAPMKRPSEVKVEYFNHFEAEGGVDSESIERGLTRISGDLRRRTRAVTRDDFSELAMMTPGVELGRAECLPLFHAPDQASPRAGVVSVVVWPKRDPQHPNAPVPDAYQLKRVCQWLDTKRLVTTELYVMPPSYRRIAISLAVKVKEGFGLDAVRDWVELVLRQYLAPLPPYGPEGEGWPLGRRVLDRELEGVAMQVEGVEYVAALRLAGWNADRWQEAPAVTLQSWEVPEVAAIAIVDDASEPPEPGKNVAPPVAAGVPIPVLREEC
jgi:hypothetical protein